MGNLIEWNSAFSINNELVDEQHEKLVDMINELYGAMKNKKGSEMVLKTFLKLIQYAITHFKDEEALFDPVPYPGKREHKILHRQFIAKLKEWHAEILDGKKPLSVDMLHFLLDWLLDHIKVVDKEMASYL